MIFKKKKKLENEWPMPSLFFRKRKHFSLLPRTKKLIRKMFHPLSYSEIETSYLTNTILPDNKFKKIIEKHPNTISCIRSVRVFHGDFDDPTFDWHIISSGSLELSDIEFTTTTVFLRGSTERLRGLSLLHTPDINTSSCVIVEMFAFSEIDLRDISQDHFSSVLSKLSDTFRLNTSHLLVKFKIATGNIYLKSQPDEPTPQAIQQISYRPFETTHNVFTHSFESDRNFKLKPSTLNANGTWQAILKKTSSPADWSVTYLILSAIETRISGNLIVPPILCHAAVENLFEIIENNIFDKSEVIPEKFKKRFMEIEKRLNFSPEESNLKNLYLKYVYSLRNECTHTGQNISPFLSDYCIWVTKTLIYVLLKNINLAGVDSLNAMTFPFEGHSVEFLTEKTKILNKVYGQDFQRFVLTPDQNIYSPDVTILR